MAAKKNAKKSSKARRKAKPMQVVSLKSALHMVRQAERRIRVRGYPRRKNPDDMLDEILEENPLRHFPKMKGRGRPTIKKKWTMVSRLANNRISEMKFTATKDEAYALANRLLKRTVKGSKVAEIMLDDGR